MTSQAPKNQKPQSLFLSIIDQQHQIRSPQLLTTKTNILLFMLAFAGYGVYYLIGDFINLIIIGYISGLAYLQARNKWTRELQQYVGRYVGNQGHQQHQQQGVIWRGCKAVGVLAVGVVLPRVRVLLSQPNRVYEGFSFSLIFQSFANNSCLTVLLCQIFCCLCSIYFLLGRSLNKLTKKLIPSSTSTLQTAFAILILVLTCLTILLIPTILYRQLSQTGTILQQKLQQSLGCSLIPSSSSASLLLPSCSEKIAENSQFKQFIQEFKAHNQTIRECKVYLYELEELYVGRRVLGDCEGICTWVVIIRKLYQASPMQAQQLTTSSLVLTGTNLFQHILQNLTSLLQSLSNTIFSISIFISTLLFTIKFPNNSSTLYYIFSQQKRQLILNVTKLVHSTCLIALWHFFISIVMLEIFQYTPVNFIVSVGLGFGGFVPYVRPSAGVVLGGVARAVGEILRGDWLSLGVGIFFVILYWTISQRIYLFYYSRIGINEAIVSTSVLFGIYSFGVIGIIYGPLIVIFFTCVEKELVAVFQAAEGRAEVSRNQEVDEHKQRKGNNEVKMKEQPVKLKWLSKQQISLKKSTSTPSKQQ